MITGKTINELSSTTPSINDTTISSEVANPTISKRTTWQSIRDLFKSNFDTVYSKYSGDADFYQYSISRTVDGSGNLTVTLKNYEGNDPTPTKPVKIMIGGVVRTITSARSVTINSGTNWFNSGSSELATKEIDYFQYIAYNATNNECLLFISRIPYATVGSDFSSTSTNEKYVATPYGFNPIDKVTNIGRFNAILSGGGAYTWSIPGNSVIVNRPIYETRALEWNETISAGTSTGITSVYKKYTVSGHMVHIEGQINISTPQTTINSITATLPFSSITQSSSSTHINDGGADVSSGGFVNYGAIDIKKIGNFSGFIVIRYNTSYII